MKRYILPALFALGVTLRALLIWNAPLWYDENFTLALALLPFDRMIAATAGDVHPPLWYIIEWITFHSGDWPAWTIRLWPLAFSILSMIAFLRIMREMIVPARVQMLAFALMASAPFQIWYAQEGRMYAMLEFLALAALYNALTKKWWRFTFAAALMFYTQNYGFFYLAAVGMVMLIRYPRAVWRAIAHGALAVVMYLPWATVVMRQMAQFNGTHWISDRSFGSVLVILQKLFLMTTMTGYGFGLMTISQVVVFVALIIGAWTTARSSHPFKWVVLVMAFAPVVMAWVVSAAWVPLLLFRPLIGSSPFLYLIAAWTIERLPVTEPARRLSLSYAGALAAPLVVLGLIAFYGNAAAMKSEGDTRPMLEVLDYIRRNWREGDVIYHTDDTSLINFMPYASDLPQYRMPPCRAKTGYAPVLGSLTTSTLNALSVHVADLSTVPHERAWVIALKVSPLHPQCYQDQIRPLTQGDPLIQVDDNKFIQSGVWLVANN